MKTSVLIRALCLTALAIFIISSAKAQSDVTIEYRLDSVCSPADVFNKTGAEYLYWKVKVEKRLVGERPKFTYAVDTDGDKKLDKWSDSPEVCEEASREARDCQELPYGSSSLIFEDKDGQDNVRLKSEKPSKP